MYSLDAERVERQPGVHSNMRAGSMLLFDFRTHHRGRAHRKNDAPRPVAYCVFGAPGVSDRHNFSAAYESVWDCSEAQSETDLADAHGPANPLPQL